EDRLGVLAKQRGQLVAHHFEDLLVGRKLQHHFAADGLLADVSEQLVGHTHVDVTFEQSFANFPERGVQVLFGELALSAQILEGSLQFLGEVLKHDSSEYRDLYPAESWSV